MVNVLDNDDKREARQESADAKQLLAEQKALLKAEDDKISSAGTENESTFRNWDNLKLQDTKRIQGDPTSAYVQRDVEVKAKHAEILKGYENSSERVKAGVKAKLDQVVRDQNYQAAKQSGAQQDTYKNNIFESQVEMDKNSTSENAGYIQKGDDSSYIKFNKSLNDIGTTVSKRAVEKGSGEVVDKNSKDFNHAYIDESGELVKIKLNDNAQLRIAQETDDAISNSITAMIDSGYTEEAREAFEKYQGRMTEESKGKVNKKFTTTSSRKQAGQFLTGINGKSEEEKKVAINSIDDVSLKNDVLKLENSIKVQTKKKKTLQNEMNTEALLSDANSAMESDLPPTWYEYQGSPAYKARYDLLDDKGKQLVREAIESPKHSNSSALFKVQNAFYDDAQMEAFATMTRTQFDREYLAGLTSSDKRKFGSRFDKLQKDPSNSEMRASMNFAGNEIERQLTKSDLISKTRKGKYSSKEQEIINLAQKEYDSYIETSGKRLNPEESKKVIKEMTATAIRGDAWFGKGDVEGFSIPRKKKEIELKKPASADSLQNRASSTDIFKGMSFKDKKDWKNRYVEATGKKRPASNNPDYIKWVESKKEKGI